MTAPTPGTPATTWPTDEEVAAVLDFDDFPSGVALELMQRQVAAREAAAREEGRAEVQAEMDTAVHALLGQRDAEESAAMQLRAERAELFTELGKATAERDALRAEVAAAGQQAQRDLAAYARVAARQVGEASGAGAAFLDVAQEAEARAAAVADD